MAGERLDCDVRSGSLNARRYVAFPIWLASDEIPPDPHCIRTLVPSPDGGVGDQLYTHPTFEELRVAMSAVWAAKA